MHIGLSAISNQLCEENYEFLYVVQERLVKLWFGVSKFASTSSLAYAVELVQELYIRFLTKQMATECFSTVFGQ